MTGAARTSSAGATTTTTTTTTGTATSRTLASGATPTETAYSTTFASGIATTGTIDARAIVSVSGAMAWWSPSPRVLWPRRVPRLLIRAPVLREDGEPLFTKFWRPSPWYISLAGDAGGRASVYRDWVAHYEARDDWSQVCREPSRSSDRKRFERPDRTRAL